MKFRVEGICPFQKPELHPALIQKIESILPMTIQVLKRPAHPPPNGCALKKYRVPSRVANRVRSRIGFNLPSARDFSVCEHMGHLIE
jgi:hypothetical protein